MPTAATRTPVDFGATLAEDLARRISPQRHGPR